MTEQIVKQQPAQRPSALATMAGRLNVDPQKLLDTLKATAFKGASDAEMLALCIVSNEYKLNPLTKEIYAYPAKGGGIQPVVSVDGWLRICNDHPQLDGIEFERVEDAEGSLYGMTCRIYRKDRSRPTEVTEYLSECKRNTEPWKMESRMMRHKSLIQCARYAFGFSGIVDEDDAERMRNVTPPAGPSEPINPFGDPPREKKAKKKKAPAKDAETAEPAKASNDGEEGLI